MVEQQRTAGLRGKLQSAGELDESKLIFKSLLNNNKEVIAYHIALADVLFTLEEIDNSKEIYENAA